MSRDSANRAAAFYDVDGTLVDSNIVYIYMYYALRQPRLTERFRKLISAALMSPAYAVTEYLNRDLLNRLFYRNYKGMPLETLQLMGRELVREAIVPNLYEQALGRIEKGRQLGLRQYLVSSSIDFVVEPLAEILKVDGYICNHLEFSNAIATGRLTLPIVSGQEKQTTVRRFAIDHDIDLDCSYAFADSKFDIDLLECVGFPVAVNPDSALQKRAASGRWPIVQFSRKRETIAQAS